MKVFEQYVKKFDMNNNNVKSKYFHSLKVMELSSDIAATIGLFDEEEIVVVEMIGLFHEIANFNNAADNVLGDEGLEDFTLKSIEILFDDGLIRKITDETKYDDLIKLAIYASNKNGLPSGASAKEIAFCKVLRDAHKLDTFRKILNYPIINTRIESYPSSMVYDKFKQFKVIDKKLSESNSDDVIIALSEVFSLNYRYSYAILKRNDYIDKIINSLRFSDKKTSNFFAQIGKVLNVYINKKMGE